MPLVVDSFHWLAYSSLHASLDPLKQAHSVAGHRDLPLHIDLRHLEHRVPELFLATTELGLWWRLGWSKSARLVLLVVSFSFSNPFIKSIFNLIPLV